MEIPDSVAEKMGRDQSAYLLNKVHSDSKLMQLLQIEREEKKRENEETNSVLKTTADNTTLISESIGDIVNNQNLCIELLKQQIKELEKTNMSLEGQLSEQKEINTTLEKQLTEIKKIFISGEDRADVQKRIFEILQEKKIDVRGLLADKGMDAVIGAVLSVFPYAFGLT